MRRCPGGCWEPHPEPNSEIGYHAPVPPVPRALNIEMIDDVTAGLLRRMTGAERLALADRTIQGAREAILFRITREHPDWPPARVRAELARRLGYDAP